VHIGVAMDLTEGLIVTVLRDTDRRPLKAIATDLIALRERAQAGRLSLNDVTGSTFTVTSLEGLAVDAFTPVINPPQAAILGVGRVRDVARFEGERVVRARVTTLSLTFDHRVTDGAPAARFLGRVCELLDRPYLLM
jgi:pyruvate dehydrogenase E2 component (dihydrolipoamide acetyltransferase)